MWLFDGSMIDDVYVEVEKRIRRSKPSCMCRQREYGYCYLVYEESQQMLKQTQHRPFESTDVVCTRYVGAC